MRTVTDFDRQSGLNIHFTESEYDEQDSSYTGLSLK